MRQIEESTRYIQELKPQIEKANRDLNSSNAAMEQLVQAYQDLLKDLDEKDEAPRKKRHP